MRKATQKAPSSPVSLGTKRTCPKCETKFYDLKKEVPVCPKCDTKLQGDDLLGLSRTESTPKKKREIPEEALMETEDIVVGSESSEFESVEDLDDDEEDVVEDIEVEDDDKDY